MFVKFISDTGGFPNLNQSAIIGSKENEHTVVDDATFEKACS